MSYVPHEIRSNILSFLPPDDLAETIHGFGIDLDDLADEATQLGLDPTVILAQAIAQERARRRDQRRLQVIPQRLFDLFNQDPDGVTLSYHGHESPTIVDTRDPEMLAKLRRLGLDVFTSEYRPGSVLIRGFHEYYPGLLKVYREKFGRLPAPEYKVLFPLGRGYRRRR